jgi:nucleoredoxin
MKIIDPWVILMVCLGTGACLAISLVGLPAQSKTAPASDNPTAALNLSGSSVSTAPAAAVSPFVKQFKNSLITSDDGTVKPFDASTLNGVQYWAFYYSASWCPPCRAFTPKLVEFYKTFKKTHPNFELIFVNDDQTEDAMMAYMKMDDMTWPAVRFADIDSTNAKKYCGSGIPDLVLTDASGKVLSDSFDGQDYLGPEKVMDDIQKMVPQPAGN